MNIKDQVLSIDQVRELQELGFDIEKHASMKWSKNTTTEDYYVDVLTENHFEIECFGAIPTLTIGDIIEILPEKIKIYSAIADKELYFYLRVTKAEVIYAPLIIDDSLSCSNEDKFINILFDTLVWCIKEKHIEL